MCNSGAYDKENGGQLHHYIHTWLTRSLPYFLGGIHIEILRIHTKMAISLPKT
jgi:hypothetical protein